VITIITAVHLVVCFFVIVIVLLQHGKGADMGATFGGGSQTLFGAAGADTLLTKVTTGLAIVFMATSVTLAAHKYELMGSRGATGRIFQDLPAQNDAAPAPQAGGSAPVEAVPGAPTPVAPAAPAEGGSNAVAPTQSGGPAEPSAPAN
jgi:preprotein translocase subunit SecG